MTRAPRVLAGAGILALAALAGCASVHHQHVPAVRTPLPPNLVTYGRGSTILVPRMGEGSVTVSFTAPSAAFFVVFWCLGPSVPTLGEAGQAGALFPPCKRGNIDAENLDSTPGSTVSLHLQVSRATHWELYVTQFGTG